MVFAKLPPLRQENYKKLGWGAARPFFPGL